MNNLLYQLEVCESELNMILSQPTEVIASQLDVALRDLKTIHSRIKTLSESADNLFGKPR